MRELLGQSIYVVDERAVAEAIVLRARARITLAEQTFRSEDRGLQVRSFRRNRDARSFRLSGHAHRDRVHH